MHMAGFMVDICESEVEVEISRYCNECLCLLAHLRDIRL